MNLKRYQSAINEIEATLKSHPGGWADKAAFAEIVWLADQVLWNEDSHPYVADKVSELKRLAEILYSARKHCKFTTPDELGTVVLEGVGP